MNKLIQDLEVVFRNNWKTILLISVSAYLLISYPDIKQGITDGWMNR